MKLIQLKSVHHFKNLDVVLSNFALALFLKVNVSEFNIIKTMKKLILITSCVALFAVASYAQSDTTRTKSSSTQSQAQQRPQDKQQSDQMRNEDMRGWTKVQSTDVPSNLRTTLNGSQYSGWESGDVYKNESGEYRVTTSGANGKTYYFDKNGKATTKPNRGGTGTNPHK
jgi:hypothetical protein